MNSGLAVRISERHRFTLLLVVPSLFGVALLLLAVSNAARDLEALQAVDNLQGLVNTYAADAGSPEATRQRALSSGAHHAAILEGGEITASAGAALPVTPGALEAARISPAGGLLDRGDHQLLWTLSDLGAGQQLLLVQRRPPPDTARLREVYSSRLVTPAAFYIWLMVWLAFVIRHLTGKLQRQKARLEHLALHDPLSGLPNRNLVNERLGCLLRAARHGEGPFAVALIDLDGFKGINDTYGHEAGDALICAVADRLSEVIRPVDTAGRVGGDEFILLLDGADAPAATALCRRARAAIARPVQLPTAEVTIGASIGVAIYPTDGDDIEALLRSADHAMYAIKTRGGGVLLYDRERHTAAA